MTPLAEKLLAEWRENGRRWERFAKEARGAGLQVWNPALYALDIYQEYLTKFPPEPGAILALGLNPGPYGMAQTGIPFTDCRTASGALGMEMTIPGKAPDDLISRLKKANGKWRGTYERSSLGMYRFLILAWGDIKTAYRNWFVGNPCPLLFLDPERWNVTPADPRLRRMKEVGELRQRAVIGFSEILNPRGIVCFGKDVAKAVGEVAIRQVGPDRVVFYEHPARAVPEKWAAGLLQELTQRQLLTGKPGVSPVYDRPEGDGRGD